MDAKRPLVFIPRSDACQVSIADAATVQVEVCVGELALGSVSQFAVGGSCIHQAADEGAAKS